MHFCSSNKASIATNEQEWVKNQPILGILRGSIQWWRALQLLFQSVLDIVYWEFLQALG